MDICHVLLDKCHSGLTSTLGDCGIDISAGLKGVGWLVSSMMMFLRERCFKEFFRPFVVEALRDPFTAAQLRDGVLTAQSFQYDPDLLFCGMLPSGLAFDRSNRVLGRVFPRDGLISFHSAWRGKSP